MTTKSQQPAQEEESKGLTFQYLQPFRTSGGQIVTMKALLTIHGNQYVEVNENSLRYKPKDLQLLTPEEIAEYESELLYEQALLELEIKK